MNAKTFGRLVPLVSGILAVAAAGCIRVSTDAQASRPIVVPKAYNARDLGEWATPLPALGVRPGFFSESEFERIPAATLYRSYPAYHPDREPPGYWEWLQKQPPKPLLDVSELRTQSDWIAAGKIVFRELYRAGPGSTADLVPLARSRDALARAGVETMPDGTLPLLWVVTPDGVEPKMKTCQSCHTRYLDDGTALDGAPANHGGAGVQRLIALRDAAPERSTAQRRAQAYQGCRSGAPWLKDDHCSAINSMTSEELSQLEVENRYGLAILPRGGDQIFPVKTLDLNGVRDRKYLNHTATHLNRDVGDIMRYALNVECCSSGMFGSYRLRPNPPRFRYPDDVLFALASYIYSLQPPPSPYRNNPLAVDGRKVFERAGCGHCHTPPLYTNNKLTPAQGFVPPADHPYHDDIMPDSVGTDPGRATQTSVATGFYRVPSLRGVWYRGLFGHSGDVASLEEWFDPARLRDDFVPSGFKGVKPTRAVRGHEYGLTLPAAEKRALIAFLKTL